MQNRAKIFMPFDALGGLREAIKREEEKHENNEFQIYISNLYVTKY